MKSVLTFVFTLTALPAQAHPGHIVEGLAGHDHWVAGAAVGIAILVGIWGALKGKDKVGADADDLPEDDLSEDEVQEA
ncbi:MAG: hypothetical protein OEZ19_09815 [Paracoccaceae bacterium]|nr:hypothetical protein [Paracoccaceae bacterium]